jgi:hypothetical protein
MRRSGASFSKGASQISILLVACLPESMTLQLRLCKRLSNLSVRPQPGEWLLSARSNRSGPDLHSAGVAPHVWTGCPSQVRTCCRKSLICIRPVDRRAGRGLDGNTHAPLISLADRLPRSLLGAPDSGCVYRSVPCRSSIANLVETRHFGWLLDKHPPTAGADDPQHRG